MMNKKTLAQHKAQYQLNRHKMMEVLKKNLPILEKVAKNGVSENSAEEEVRMAKVACCLLVSEIYYEKSVMEDKTGKTNPKDTMDDFLKRLMDTLDKQ